MIKIKAKTEARILDSAYKTFLLFGYHGTTMQQIAMQAGVNKSAVHYYFRSKERLYTLVVKKVLSHTLKTKVNNNTYQNGFEKPTWFLVTELYNNQNLFECALKDIYQDGWNEKLNDLLKWFDLKNIPSHCVSR